MIEAALPENEEERLRKLYELGILDTLEEQAYDDLTRLAAEICGTPIALVSLIDRDRQWFKSHHGLPVRETPRNVAFCAHAILNDDVLVVEDSSKDERFHDNPLFTDVPHVRFYAGAPLILSDKLRLGTLCVIGNEARSMSPAQKESLKALARQVVSQLELRLKLHELESLDQAKDEFISLVSHELRTPLTAIFGSLALLLSGKTGKSAESKLKFLEMSYRNTQRLLNIVNDILDVSQIESGKLKLHKEQTNITTLLEESVALNQQYCIDCNTDVTLHYPENNAEIIVNCDKQRLLQVMSNLISNAAKFTHADDTIEINLKVEDNYAVVEVTDHGPGIPAEQQVLLFKKFQQLGTKNNNKPPGTGLGLNISKNIIMLHQGVMDLDSVPNVKTTFYFRIPLTK